MILFGLGLKECIFKVCYNVVNRIRDLVFWKVLALFGIIGFFGAGINRIWNGVLKAQYFGSFCVFSCSIRFHPDHSKIGVRAGITL